MLVMPQTWFPCLFACDKSTPSSSHDLFIFPFVFLHDNSIIVFILLLFLLAVLYLSRLLCMCFEWLFPFTYLTMNMLFIAYVWCILFNHNFAWFFLEISVFLCLILVTDFVSLPLLFFYVAVMVQLVEPMKLILVIDWSSLNAAVSPS